MDLRQHSRTARTEVSEDSFASPLAGRKEVDRRGAILAVGDEPSMGPGPLHQRPTEEQEPNLDALRTPSLERHPRETNGYSETGTDRHTGLATSHAASRYFSALLLLGDELARQIEDEDRSPEPETYRPPLGYGPDATANPDRYARWFHHRYGPGGEGAIAPPATGPLLSVVVPIFQPDLALLDRCFASVFSQSYARWELCLCDDGSGDPALEAYLSRFDRDPRIRRTRHETNMGISAATNSALALAKGDFVCFLDQDDELVPHALAHVAASALAHPDADVFYSDEDKLDPQGRLCAPAFKPDFSPDFLLSINYICHLLAIRRSLIEELGGLRRRFDGAQDHDLVLRATERARKVVHIREVLYHWRMIPGSAAAAGDAKPWAHEAGIEVIREALHRRGEEAVVERSPQVPGGYQIRRRPKGKPLVSVVIPFRDQPRLLRRCVDSLLENPGWDRFELLLVDNDSAELETAALLDRLAAHPKVRVLSRPGEFNWAAINNEAARKAQGDYLLFMNNDVEALSPRWMEVLLGHAQRPEVGMVGARLLYPDRYVQHAGIVIRLFGIAGHILQGLDASLPGYASWAVLTRNVSAVTGACAMSRREVFEEVGGFDEALTVAFNDVDYCLRLAERGYLVVYAANAELIHHESRSRGYAKDRPEIASFVRRWRQALDVSDPYFNPHLSLFATSCDLRQDNEDQLWAEALSNYLSLAGLGGGQ